MKVSLNSVLAFNEKYGSAGDIAAIGVTELANKIGAQLGAIESVVELGSKYQGIIIAKVVSCVDHPDADRLHVCKIDDGGKAQNVERDENSYVQVVCGAPNVREGLFVAWLPPGSTVPSSFGDDPFVLEARELRGVVSNGMLASPKELALGDSHDGILEIDGDRTPGADFAETFRLSDEVVFDIENKMFTHRPDCFGLMGVARELAGIQGMPFKSPDWYVINPEFPTGDTSLPLQLVNELPELVPRFSAVALSGVNVGPSPVWLQVFLSKIGQKSINNIVDLTNFYMLQTGQPLHAYDYDKVKALSAGDATIVVRKPKTGETIKLLNGKEIEPRAEAIMIATDKQLIGAGGVMGGTETEVDLSTKNIILECATFDMYSIRRTSMTHGLFTEAVTRFSKGQSPLQNVAVLAEIVKEINRVAGGTVASALVDNKHVSYELVTLTVAASFINDRLGFSLSADEIAKILQNVEFVVSIAGTELTITVPFWRTDIEIAEDIVEEVGRLYGFDHLPLVLPSRSVKPTVKDGVLTLKSQIRDILSRAGANEVLTYSFVHGNLLDTVGQDKTKAFQLSNALSPDLQYYRQSLVPSLLEKIHMNVKAGYERFALFELGKGHETSKMLDDLPEEYDNIALVFTDNRKGQTGAAYYHAEKYLMNLGESLGVKLELRPATEASWPDDAPFELGRSATVHIAGQKNRIGIVGELKSSVRRSLKLPAKTAAFELWIGTLNKHQAMSSYQPLSRFPKVEQDICLKVANNMPYQTLYDVVEAEIVKANLPNTSFKLSPIDIYQKEETSKQITLRLSIASYEKTMTDTEVSALLDTVAVAAKATLDAERI